MNAIDLSRLPAPDLVEPLDFETLLESRKAALLAHWPEAERPAIAERLALESEPLTKLLQESAYRELLLRQRINDAGRAVLVAFARGADLDQLLALLQVQRLASEPDDAYRQRALMSVFAYATAGPAEAYRYHARSAHPEVRDARCDRPAPGTVRVTVLSQVGDGNPAAELLQAVERALTADDVRPLNDQVLVHPAAVLHYRVHARLHHGPGATVEPLLEAARAALQRYTREQHRIGAAIRLSGLYAALHQPGLQRVELLEPTWDWEPDALTAPWCSEVHLETASHHG